MSGTFVDVPIHLQNDIDNCGEACAQMVLACLTKKVAHSQDALAAVKRRCFTEWSTEPDDLARMINHGLNTNQHAPYSTQTFTTHLAAMSYALTALKKGVPVVPLTLGESHWVVLKGVTDGSDQGVLLRDPTPLRTQMVTAGELAPQLVDVHAAGDECAAFDQVQGGAEPEGEVWNCRHWEELFSIADHAPVKTKFVVIGPDFEVTESYSCPPVAHADAAFSRARLASAIAAGMTRLGLAQIPFWADLLGNNPNGIVRLAKQVFPDHATGMSPYYLSPLFDRNGIARAAASVDAATGVVLRVRALSTEYLDRLFLDPNLPTDASVNERWIWGFFRETFDSPFFPLLRRGTNYYRPLDRRKFSTQPTPTTL